MSWRDTLRKATFRDVPFEVDTHQAELGRRVAVHEFPLRDTPYAEDLGRKSRALTLEAYVLGADYPARRDRLVRAVELPGPGTLVHPYLGELQVTVTGCKLRESTAEGGMARFTLELVESGAATFPASKPATGEAVREARDAAAGVAQDVFKRRFTVAGRPQFVAQGAQGVFGSAMDAVARGTGLVRTQADKVASLLRAATQAKQQALTLFYEPASAAQALVNNLRALVREVAYGPREALDVARTMLRFGSGLPNVPTNTPSRRQQATNQAALVQLVRVVAAGEAAGAAAELDFDSYQDALQVRTLLADALGDLLQQSGLDDELFAALRTLRTAAVQDVTARGADLARVVSYTPAQTVPALVLAHRLYADARRAQEVVARNRVAHPGFVRGQRVLEVLADG